jgi:hypothetical protein
MAENRGRPGGKLGVAKGGSRRAKSKTRQANPMPVSGAPGRRRSSSGQVHPAGRGGRAQQAGGPEHHGLDAHEDRNP